MTANDIRNDNTFRKLFPVNHNTIQFHNMLNGGFDIERNYKNLYLGEFANFDSQELETVTVQCGSGHSKALRVTNGRRMDDDGKIHAVNAYTDPWKRIITLCDSFFDLPRTEYLTREQICSHPAKPLADYETGGERSQPSNAEIQERLADPLVHSLGPSRPVWLLVRTYIERTPVHPPLR